MDSILPMQSTGPSHLTSRSRTASACPSRSPAHCQDSEGIAIPAWRRAKTGGVKRARFIVVAEPVVVLQSAPCFPCQSLVGRVLVRRVLLKIAQRFYVDFAGMLLSLS